MPILKNFTRLMTIVIITSCSTSHDVPLETPFISKDAVYIKHHAYSLVYNEKTEQASCVFYQLLSSELEPNVKRTNHFQEDTIISTGTATNADYKNSGYDRGHLAPAADMVWNRQAMDESFYYSNISPQLASFNRGVWKTLEKKTREWAKEYDDIYICTGPIFDESNSQIGLNNISIPTGFYKVLLVYNNKKTQGLGFVFPHQKCKKDLWDYALTIDEVEEITGYNFFYSLPRKDEIKIEQKFTEKVW